MKKAEMIAILKAWETHVNAIDAQYEALHALTGAMPDCKLLEPVYKLLEAYTDQIAEKVGNNNGWLSWFWLENEMGKRGHECKLVSGKTFKVRTVSDLARCIK